MKENPDYADAWQSLADLEAHQGHWYEAIQAYVRLTKAAPTSYAGYSGQIRAYIALQLYDDALATAKKQLEKIPDGPEGHLNLGWVYLETEKFPLAAKEYESAARLLPKSPRIQIALGRAYGGALDKVKAKEAFEHANELDSSPLTLNDTAYYAAEAGLDLSVAEQRSLQAVTEIEKQLNDFELENIGLPTVSLLGRVAAYWDTLGWIKFKKGDISGAEKYLLAATDLTDRPTIQMHMGRVYEAMGRKDAAMRCYVTALQHTQVVQFARLEGGKMASQPPRRLSADEREAKERLAKLAGSPAGVAGQMKEGSYNRNWKRTVAVPNPHATEKRESLAILLIPGPNIASSTMLPVAKGASELLNRFADKLPPQTFPDENTKIIPRVASIQCLTNPLQCEFAFLPYDESGSAFTQPEAADQ